MYDAGANSWTTLPAAPISDRVGATTIWTGREVLVFGGKVSGSGTTLQLATDDASYDPATRTWGILPTAPPSSQIPGDPLAAATARWFAYGAWDGARARAIVLGGAGDTKSQGLFDGFTFEPAT